ncbi:AIPR family protein [Fibrobacter sp.]|uniref:AIPR family protein n=1 Tax=Fibrobacter sp. TaxID=35828 RepID=UPI00388D5743
MITLEEFRDRFINEDINASAAASERHEVEVFIEESIDILTNDYSLITEMTPCYHDFSKGNRAYKNMHIDAAFLDIPSNVLNLLYADYNEGEIASITNEFIKHKSQLLISFFENVLKDYFDTAEKSSEAYQLAENIKKNIEYINKLHLFIVSTNKLSKVVKKIKLPEVSFKDRTFQVIVDILDIENIYRSKLASFKKDDIVINCSDYNLDGIPYIQANLDTDQYESYLAVVPGKFLSDIYKEYDSSLLESNVRSFLKFNGAVNKGIRSTILNEKDKFFTYNNGISTTAENIERSHRNDGTPLITSFKNLQIINGGQTTATLAATSIKNKADLSGIYVQMKLTVLKQENPELVRNIATYANSQNKVKTADLNSSHPFYVLIENYSRKIYAPKTAGSLIQPLWFFERARGQYEQPMMQMSKAEALNYKLLRPKDKKFTLVDLAKYENASKMLPYYVSWGGEVNAARFHSSMLEQWEKDNSIYNELYYKELIGKKILFTHIEKTVSNQSWYQEKKAYRPQIVAYTFAKLVYSAEQVQKKINYKEMWDLQDVPSAFNFDIENIAKIVFDCINDEKRETTHIETYCKKETCWTVVKKVEYHVSDELSKILVGINN